MDWESFNGAVFGGVIASLAGVITTLFLTGKSEEKRAIAASEKAEEVLYSELSDLALELEGIIKKFYTVYSKYKAFEIMGGTEYLTHITMPRTISFLIMRSLMKDCYPDLTKEQRHALKILLYINEQINELYPKTLHDVRFNSEKVNVRDVEALLSCFCTCYHNLSSLSLQKRRFKCTDKDPIAIVEDVLVSLGYSLDRASLLKHANKNVMNWQYENDYRA